MSPVREGDRSHSPPRVARNLQGKMEEGLKPDRAIKNRVERVRCASSRFPVRDERQSPSQTGRARDSGDAT